MSIKLTLHTDGVQEDCLQQIPTQGDCLQEMLKCRRKSETQGKHILNQLG